MPWIKENDSSITPFPALFIIGFICLLQLNKMPLSYLFGSKTSIKGPTTTSLL